MIKVYQTIFDNKRGNCQAAVWASLLHLELPDVPNFVEYDEKVFCDFIRPYGYEYHCYLINGNRTDLKPEVKAQYDSFKNELPDFGHIEGLYDATVYSPKLFPACHAVIVDRKLNIVHDPNPNYSNLKAYPFENELGYNGIIGIALYRKVSNN